MAVRPTTQALSNLGQGLAAEYRRDDARLARPLTFDPSRATSTAVNEDEIAFCWALLGWIEVDAYNDDDNGPAVLALNLTTRAPLIARHQHLGNQHAAGEERHQAISELLRAPPDAVAQVMHYVPHPNVVIHDDDNIGEISRVAADLVERTIENLGSGVL